LIAARSSYNGVDEQSKPKMLIDTNGVPHGFCIRKYMSPWYELQLTVDSGHSEVIAVKVAAWIKEILDQDKA
jgi:hypothetical protein